MILIRPPDWWPEPMPEGHASCFSKAFMELNKQPDDGTSTSRNEWSGTDTRRSTAKRLFSRNTRDPTP